MFMASASESQMQREAWSAVFDTTKGPTTQFKLEAGLATTPGPSDRSLECDSPTELPSEVASPTELPHLVAHSMSTQESTQDNDVTIDVGHEYSEELFSIDEQEESIMPFLCN